MTPGAIAAAAITTGRACGFAPIPTRAFVGSPPTVPVIDEHRVPPA